VRIGPAGFLLILFTMILFAPSAFATEDVGITPSTLRVEAEVRLSSSFLLFADVRHEMILNITASGPENLPMRNFSIIYGKSMTIGDVITSPPNANFSIAFFNEFFNELKVSLPTDTNQFSALISVSFSGDSIFLRNTASIPVLQVILGVPPFTPTAYTILIPEEQGVNLINLSEQDMFQIERGDVGFNAFLNPSGRVVVLYEREGRLLGSFLTIGAIATASFGSTFLLSKTRVPAFIRSIPKNFPGLRTRSPARILLTLYFTVAILILALSVAFGPSPTPKIYISATPSTAELIIPIVRESGYGYVTASEGGSSFDVMASLGSYDAAIIADFVPGFSGEQALPGLGSLRTIYILSDTAPPEFVETAKRVWEASVIVLEDPSELSRFLRLPLATNNLFGVTVSQGAFNSVLGLLGVLSLIIPLLATAALSSRMLESTHSSAISALVEVIGYSVMIFIFTQMVYMSSAVLLKVPLGLHAGGGSTNLTAVGVLGFGGGSRPRMLAAGLGFLIGILITKEGRMKFDRTIFLALLLLGTFIIVNPLNTGLLFHQFFASFTTSFQSETTFQSVTQIKGFIGSSGAFWTSPWTSAFFIQRGVPLLYVAVMAMSLFSRLEKSVATLVLLIASFVASFGFMRIADQVPVKSLASIPPGLMLGFLVIPVVIALSYGEYLIRRRI